jgi:hypothetical protein
MRFFKWSDFRLNGRNSTLVSDDVTQVSGEGVPADGSGWLDAGKYALCAH